MRDIFSLDLDTRLLSRPPFYAKKQTYRETQRQTEE